MWPSLGLLLHRIKVPPSLHARGILVRVLIIGINIISTVVIVIAINTIAIPCIIVTVIVIISLVIILNNTLSSSRCSLKKQSNLNNDQIWCARFAENDFLHQSPENRC